MKVRSIVFVILLIIIFALMGSGVGCSESDSSSIKEMMKDIPQGVSSFAYYDLKVMHGDSDLEGLYNDIRQDYLTKSVMYNIEFGDINYLADCGNKGVVIFKGEFDFGAIRNALEDNDYIAVGYRQEEVWLNSGKATMVALLNDMVAIGDKDDVEEYINVRKGEAGSLLDSEDTRDVMDKLPGGIVVYLSDGIGFGEESLATSYKKKDGETMSITNIFKYGVADKAEEAKDLIEAMFIATTDYEDVKVERDVEFIILTGQLAITDMVQ